MREELTDASEELKRVDHLIYVSLKYTRSVDVIRNVLQRIINALEFMIEAHLVNAEEEGKINGVPNLVIEKCTLLREVYASVPELLQILDFYQRLRKIMRAQYTKSQEFRRHVTMTVQMEGEEIPLEIHIDKVQEYYVLLKEYFEFTYKTLQEHEEKKESKKKKK